MQKINLLPPELRKDPTIDLKRIISIAAVTTIIGLLSLAFISLMLNSYLREKEIETIRAEIAALQPKVNKVEQLKKEIAANQRKIDTYQDILDRPVPWPEILRDIAFNSPTNLWLTEAQTSRVEIPVEPVQGQEKQTNSGVQETAEKQETNGVKESKEKKEVKSELYFIIRGYSPSLTSIGVLILHLNQLSDLEEVNLVLAKEPEDERIPRGILEFEIKTKIKNSKGGQK